jgi:putative ABC transport system permease protein
VIQVYGGRKITYNVVGVIKDFHFTSLKESIKPLKLFLSLRSNRLISVKVKAEEIPKTLKFIKDTWAGMFPNIPFEYYFFDEVFERRYRSEANLRRLFTQFSALAVFIGCLGLLGLAAYAADRRNKEIGIRKVLGASSPQIIMLLSKEFSRWVLAANVIAWPVAYWVMHSWLNDFAYRISISRQWMFFVLAGVLALGIALLTVSFQAVKAAMSDPVKALKYE